MVLGMGNWYLGLGWALFGGSGIWLLPLVLNSGLWTNLNVRLFLTIL